MPHHAEEHHQDHHQHHHHRHHNSDHSTAIGHHHRSNTIFRLRASRAAATSASSATQALPPQPVYPAVDVFAPANELCPKCNVHVTTEVQLKNGRRIRKTAIILGIFCFCFGGCFFPFCNKGLKDVEHSCPTCGTVIKVYENYPE